MLILLPMLIITIPIQLYSVSLNMPVGKPPPPVVQPQVVVIDADGRVRWNRKAVCKTSGPEVP